MTTDPRAAYEFCRQHNAVVYKPMVASGLAEDNDYRLLYCKDKVLMS